MLPAGPLPRGGPAGAGWAWSGLVDGRWQDLLGRLEAAVDEIEEIGLPVERHPTPCGHVLDHAAEGAPFVVLLAGCRCVQTRTRKVCMRACCGAGLRGLCLAILPTVLLAL
jgi:hypothetical protein